MGKSTQPLGASTRDELFLAGVEGETQWLKVNKKKEKKR